MQSLTVSATIKTTGTLTHEQKAALCMVIMKQLMKGLTCETHRIEQGQEAQEQHHQSAGVTQVQRSISYA